MSRETQIDIHDEGHPGPGRPRGFDMEAAIDAGMALLLHNGFEATSLDALTRTMGISRSSFYAAFGSKRGVLVKALERYSRARLAVLERLATGPEALGAVLRALAGIDGDAHGCLLVNCVTELAPRDAEVGAFGAAHLGRVETLVGRCLPRPDPAAAVALVALALGVQTLRKSGVPPVRLTRTIDLAIARMAR